MWDRIAGCDRPRGEMRGWQLCWVSRGRSDACCSFRGSHVIINCIRPHEATHYSPQLRISCQHVSISACQYWRGLCSTISKATKLEPTKFPHWAILTLLSFSFSWLSSWSSTRTTRTRTLSIFPSSKRRNWELGVSLAKVTLSHDPSLTGLETLVSAY